MKFIGSIFGFLLVAGMIFGKMMDAGLVPSDRVLVGSDIPSKIPEPVNRDRRNLRRDRKLSRRRQPDQRFRFDRGVQAGCRPADISQ